MINIKNKLIYKLIIVNLIALLLILIGKIYFIKKIFITLVKSFIVPLMIAVLIYYIVRPLNNIFIKKGMRRDKASLLTLVIFIFILSGLITYFSRHVYEEFAGISNRVWLLINDKKNINESKAIVNNFININQLYELVLNMVKVFIQQIGINFMRIVGYFMDGFSIVFLIIVIVYYLLRDGDKFKTKVMYFVPEKYKIMSNEIMTQSDIILSHYVTGQAKVALSLSIMILIGYKFIGMPNALLFSIITFVLAFIPFVGFFISMIIPIVISITIGLVMFIKLISVFIIVQTLKGRIVVPAIMAKSMNIHPLTDIFLVILALAIAGPFAAFAIVPVYAIAKNIIIVYSKEKI